MSDKLYDDHDSLELDEAGGYYFRHISAMTAEALHSKAAIACQLGYRDLMIDTLKAQVDTLKAQVEDLTKHIAALHKD